MDQSLLHQRLNDLFEARRKKAAPKSKAKSPSAKDKADLKELEKLVGRKLTMWDLERSRHGEAGLKRARERRKKDVARRRQWERDYQKRMKAEAKKRKSADQAAIKAASKAAIKEARKATESAFSKAVTALGDGKDFVDAARAIDQRTPDYAAAKPALRRIYKNMLLYMEGLARSAAAKMNANAAGRIKRGPGGKEADVGWDREALPAQAVRKKFATIKGPLIGNFVLRSKKTFDAYQKAKEAKKEAKAAAAKSFTAAVKQGGKGRVRLARGAYMTFDELKAEKAKAKAAKKAGDKGTAQNAQATVELARRNYVDEHPTYLRAKVKMQKAKLKHETSGMAFIGGGGAEGLILPHEVVNEFFSNWGIATTGKTAGKPKKGFLNLIILAGRNLDPQHAAYLKTYSTQDAVALIGGAFKQFAGRVARDQGLKGGDNMSFVTFPDDGVMPASREGVDAWNASQESLKGSLKDFFKRLADDAYNMRGRAANEGQDYTSAAKKLIDKGGETSPGVKRLKVSGVAVVKSPDGGSVKIPKAKPTNKDLKVAAAGKVPSPALALGLADTKSRASLAARVFGPVTHPLMNYNEFFTQRKSRLHMKVGTKAEKSAPALRAVIDKRPSVTNWDRVVGKANIYGVVAVEIPGKGGGLMGRLVKLTGKEAIETAKRLMGRSRAKGTPGLWNDMVEFMVDQKVVRKLAKSRFAPERGRNIGVFARSGVGQEEYETLPKAQPKRGGKEAAERKRIADIAKDWKEGTRRRLRSRAKSHKGAAFKSGKAGKEAMTKFGAHLERVARFWGIDDPSKAAKAAEKHFGKGGQRSEREKIQGMTPDAFVSYLAQLDPKLHDAAKLVRVGIVGQGLTERRQPDAVAEFLDKLSPLVETERRETRLVKRLRECFAA